MKTDVKVAAPIRLELLLAADADSIVTCTTEHGVRKWTKQINRVWTRDNGEPWESPELAALLHCLGGEQTLETFETSRE
jgi:hypothetical protein